MSVCITTTCCSAINGSCLMLQCQWICHIVCWCSSRALPMSRCRVLQCNKWVESSVAVPMNASCRVCWYVCAYIDICIYMEIYVSAAQWSTRPMDAANECVMSCVLICICIFIMYQCHCVENTPDGRCQCMRHVACVDIYMCTYVYLYQCRSVEYTPDGRWQCMRHVACFDIHMCTYVYMEQCCWVLYTRPMNAATECVMSHVLIYIYMYTYMYQCRSVEYTPDGRWLITASFDGTIAYVVYTWIHIDLPTYMLWSIRISYIHTHIHTYKHTHMHMYICIHTKVLADDCFLWRHLWVNSWTCMNVYLRAYMHCYIRISCIHALKRTNIHTKIRTKIHTNKQTPRGLVTASFDGTIPYITFDCIHCSLPACRHRYDHIYDRYEYMSRACISCNPTCHVQRHVQSIVRVCIQICIHTCVHTHRHTCTWSYIHLE